MIHRLTFAGWIAALGLFSAPISVAQEDANTASEEEAAAAPFTILGLHPDMSAAQARAHMETDYPDFTLQSLSGARAGAALIYNAQDGRRITAELAPSANGQVLSSIALGFENNAALSERLQRDLTRRFGPPVQSYDLADDQRLLVWERMDTRPGASIGQVLSIALTTGQAGQLVLTPVTQSLDFIARREEAQELNRPRASTPRALTGLNGGFASPTD